MKKSDWLLLAIGDSLQPIQLHKVMFKFAHEANAPESLCYTFVPYNWGPCSFEIYDDLEHLRQEGLIEAVPTGHGWSSYRLTDAGQSLAKKILRRADQRLVAALHDIREWVTTRPFEKLLKDVYKQYPAFATQSMFTKR